MSTEDLFAAEPRDIPPEATIPVLREVVSLAPADGPDGPQRRRLDRDARAALVAEATLLLDELLDECLPALEARLRERLEQRLQEFLEREAGAPDG